LTTEQVKSLGISMKKNDYGQYLINLVADSGKK
ncbi:glucose-1-phosphate thymidylyltransferase, partial [Salmonella enterica subsp. enterica serovar Kentucky]|nr:glucose-1-phosphate thymidylyltransferase [Salmonella enterica subsp. enterica serovar Kentucky]